MRHTSFHSHSVARVTYCRPRSTLCTRIAPHCTASRSLHVWTLLVCNATPRATARYRMHAEVCDRAGFNILYLHGRRLRYNLCRK